MAERALRRKREVMGKVREETAAKTWPSATVNSDNRFPIRSVNRSNIF